MTDENAAIRRRHAGVPTEPMFDAPVTTGSGRVKRRGPRSIAFGHCPECQTEKLGKVRAAGGDLVWRDHYKQLFGGARILCSASGQPAPAATA